MGQAEPDSAGGRRRTGAVRPLRYVGPANGRFAMLLPGRLRIILMVALMAVEVPVYYKIFGYFTPRERLFTWAFTLPVALVMVLLPHLAGKQYRRRQQMPREPVIPAVTAIVMLLWLGAGVTLGWLRQKVLLVPIVDPLTGKEISAIGQLHVSVWTMTAIFATLLLMSGMIAFMLGLGEAHPVVAGYHDAVRAAEEAEDAYDEAVTRHAEAREPLRLTPDDITAASATEAGHRERALRAEYTAATEAYLDSFARETGEPAVTQAASTAKPRRQP